MKNPPGLCWIYAAGKKRIAAQDSETGFHGAPDDAIAFNGIKSILGTGRNKATGVAQVGRYQDLINFYW
jgi:hypothetical protein